MPPRSGNPAPPRRTNLAESAGGKCHWRITCYVIANVTRTVNIMKHKTSVKQVAIKMVLILTPTCSLYTCMHLHSHPTQPWCAAFIRYEFLQRINIAVTDIPHNMLQVHLISLWSSQTHLIVLWGLLCSYTGIMA